MKLNNKKGLSGVIVTLILIALALFLVSIVWVVVNDLISERLDEAGSCFGNFEEITLNSEYTCYSFAEDKVQFSINIGDVDIDSLLVTIHGAGSSESFEIKNDSVTVEGLCNYTGEAGDPVKLPSKNCGLTYTYDWDSGEDKMNTPEAIEIAPIIGGNQCSTSDSINNIGSCKTLL